MKLSDLIAFRERLNEHTFLSARDKVKAELGIVMHTVTEPLEDHLPALVAPYKVKLDEQQAELYQAFDRLNATVEELKQDIHNRIAEGERHWFQESYKLFEAAKDCEKVDHILYNRRAVVTEKTEEMTTTVFSRLSAYADWRHAGLIIRPGAEEFVNNMVGYDPLYLIDRDYELLEPCLLKFPKLYQSRLRTYITDEWNDRPLLEKIPDNQFGMCLAYNVFNYRPLEIIRKYLEEIYVKLRPGGVVLMTYNDCDRAHAVRLVERFFTSYTPGYLIHDLVKSIGFEIANTWDDGGPSVWIELKKPGELVSIRGGQVISRIYRIDDYLNDVDYLTRKVYTVEEVNALLEEATALGISEEAATNLHPYELQLMINEVLEEHRIKAAEEREHQRVVALAELARELNIDVTATNWQELVAIEQLKRQAIDLGIDVNNPRWEVLLDRALIKQEEDRRKQEEEARKIAEEVERKRVEELHNYARSLGIDPAEYPNENEINRRIAEEGDKRRKQELILLRQRAMELKAGDPNLIRYGYSVEKLRELIKAKEEGQ